MTMRFFQWFLTLIAGLLILVALLPSGNLGLFVAGLAAMLGACACAITADNRDIRFGRGRRNVRPAPRQRASEEAR
ncbi:hypothetical protein [Arthrobacter sp. RIT-PI-e]|uniref:hypothetical protein n=1 Tax=Arthrobacter sp. RIT-PI-e TaxID=1681197 RepID=UPI001364AAE1|nr:hypothetical protein [Arthrobacter sp. RIT-PI-e]